ncbi:hypothetical protein [Croceimicrobium sp.]|uniref:hypothetical protein n=1 Tax=Croceimicrobium sp. TaxID=2828340 RepID=UPI003BA84786
MKKSILSIVMGLVFLAPAVAQEASTDTTASKASSTEDLYPMWQNRHAIAISAGLPGFGLEYAYNLNRSLNLRAGFLAFTFNDYNTDMDISGQSVNVNANLTSTVFDIMLEYQPSTRSSFKLVAGLGYLNNVGVNTLILLNDDIGYGDLVIDNEEIGDIDLTVSWTGVAPYMGFGFGRAIPKKRVGFGIEVGTYYAGGPSVDIDASGMLENTSEEEAELEDNLSSYAWMPRVMARLAIKL